MKLKLKLGTYQVFFVGVVMGLGAALVQAYFSAQPPEAYGISFIGHPNDLFAWITNRVAGTEWPIRDAFLVYPVLTVGGVFIGSFAAAYRNGELKLREGPVRKKFLAVIFGFLIANLGLLWGSCPIRTSLMVSYGSIIAIVALASIAFGVVLAIIYIRIRAYRGVHEEVKQ